MKNKVFHVLPFVVSLLVPPMSLVAAPGEEDEPVRYVGEPKTSNSGYSDGYHDGQMRVAIGVQNYQILRANRTHPEWSDGLGWTYNHAPMLAYANGQFYCQYLTNPTGEHIAPGVTMWSRSKDGKHWIRPEVLFPIYYTAKDADSFEYTHMHQRMGFYIAPNGRFLTMGHYGGNEGYGIGRVVREIRPDDSLGPIYFIRLNDNWKGQVHYPLYTASPDKGFVEACDAFLADKIRRMQWWEEDRFCQDKDEFYRVPWIEVRGNKEPGKAFCFYTRDDGVVVGFFKSRWLTLTRDQGETWSKPVYCESITYGGAKIWAQRLDNGQFALVYNPTGTAARHPLSIATSDDGILFDGLVNVHGELPVKRFWGREKRPGPQYVRGIIEGNGNPPGDDLWVVYSVSKEDIWISRIPIPVRRDVTGPVQDDFTAMEPGGAVTDWNIYGPRWCPVEVVDFPSRQQKSLRLKDFDPYDYAKAVRVLPQADKQTVTFRLYVESAAQLLDIEVVSPKGQRLMQTRVGTDKSYCVKKGDSDYTKALDLQAGRWYSFAIGLDAEARRFDLLVDGKELVTDAVFSAVEGVPDRIEFRTGPYRLTDDVQEYKSGSENEAGWDEPGADEKVEAAVYYLRDFQATGPQRSVLKAEDFKHHVNRFNRMEDEPVVNAIPNAQAWSWMQANVPLFECPDQAFEEIYYYRWWTYRKHIKETPDGRVLTEFLTPVGHAGKYNTISCALGHHLYEGRWLKDQGLLDEYARFWLRGNDGGSQPHLHKYSNWLADALYNRYLVNHDRAFLIGLLPDLVKDYEQWEQEKRLDSGLFWQYDVRDGMEESISGGRRVKNARPTINSYMYANALAIARIADLAGQTDLARTYRNKAEEIRRLVLDQLWDKDANFFKVRLESGSLADVREEIGFIPWYFNLPDAGYEAAWAQAIDPEGFKAPFGLTTAERRHPQFRTHGVGTCEWDGAVWPFATAQTLTAMANALRNVSRASPPARVEGIPSLRSGRALPSIRRRDAFDTRGQDARDTMPLSVQDYFEALLTYAKAQHWGNKPYIGEYQDEKTGAWLKGASARSRYYNHSTFCDLVISGLVGLCPRADDTLLVHPLVPADTWDFFALDGVPYHGKTVTILWDQTGQRYGKGPGLSVFADGKPVAHSSALARVEGPVNP
ncbi:MAG: hypothetical protein JW993_19075 [Sedimentisphaerales bacterium]|nr:hypothetical protein [Sedimentisphaerales bacterium]